jgi:hypothetical protein
MENSSLYLDDERLGHGRFGVFPDEGACCGRFVVPSIISTRLRWLPTEAGAHL